MQNFINEKEIYITLDQTKNPSDSEISEILAKASEAKGLNLHEVSSLLAQLSAENINKIYETALTVKNNIYGKRMVLFAPLYISNLCLNDCSYCAFSIDNQDLTRKSLSKDEIRQEVEIIQQMGHKRILLEFGEHPKWTAQKMADCVDYIYSIKTAPHGETRRINVNCAPLSIEDFSILNKASIGTYQCFQETYHKETYEKLHKKGNKKDFEWRLNAMHRANKGGIDDVGLGVLFGLYDYKFEVLSLMQHAFSLENEFGAGPHTISFPRIEPAQNSEISMRPPYTISDEDFKRIIAVVRLALPYTGMIITTREKPAIKRELLKLGISQLSAGSRTSPGGYAESVANLPSSQQFQISDERTMQEIIDMLQNDGYLPSFCTGCYRLGRTGEIFMNITKSAGINSFCQENSLLTYCEYLQDYADANAKNNGMNYLFSQIEIMPEGETKSELKNKINSIINGQRDLYI